MQLEVVHVLCTCLHVPTTLLHDRITTKGMDTAVHVSVHANL